MRAQSPETQTGKDKTASDDRPRFAEVTSVALGQLAATLGTLLAAKAAKVAERASFRCALCRGGFHFFQLGVLVTLDARGGPEGHREHEHNKCVAGAHCDGVESKKVCL